MKENLIELRDAKNVLHPLTLDITEKENAINEANVNWSELIENQSRTPDENLLLVKQGLNLLVYTYNMKADVSLYRDLMSYYKVGESVLTIEQQANWQAVMGSAYRLTGCIKESIECYKMALNTEKKLNIDSEGKFQPSALFYHYITALVELEFDYGVYFMTKHSSAMLNEVRDHLSLAIKIAKQYLASSHPFPEQLYYYQARALGTLALYEYQQNQYKTSIKYILNALPTAMLGLKINVVPSNQDRFLHCVTLCAKLLLDAVKQLQGKENTVILNIKVKQLLQLAQTYRPETIEAINSLIGQLHQILIGKSIKHSFWQNKSSSSLSQKQLQAEEYNSLSQKNN